MNILKTERVLREVVLFILAIILFPFMTNLEMAFLDNRK
jgi:hypothetical protein